MSGEPQLFRINPENRQSDRIEEVDFARLGLRERRDIQEWVADNPGILGDDLLIIGKEFSGFDRTNERLDLLGVDLEGRLVVIELKRDDTGSDAHWQAIKYASYFQRTTPEVIVEMAAAYWGESREEALARVLKHLGADDLGTLNKDQRIVLASHRFAPEVASAALWLNQKIPDLITCIKLTPYRDTQTESLYVQASRIIPVPGVDIVGVGPSVGQERGSRNIGSYNPNQTDDVTNFLRKVGQLATEGLADRIKPDRTSRWAGRHWWGPRYYRLWYSRAPWSNRYLSYQIDLHQQDTTTQWQANVYFGYRDGIASLLEGIEIHPEQHIEENWIEVNVGPDTLNDEFAGEIAAVVRSFIERITPIIDDLENEIGEGDEV